MNKIIKPSELLEAQLAHEIPSQLPVHAVRASYNRMLLHGMMADAGKVQNLWACKKNGAGIKARFVKMRIMDGDVCIEYAPVAEIYCSGCDPVPTTRGGVTIAKEAVTTIMM